MKEPEGFRICELKNGRPNVLRRVKLKDLPPGITERKLRLTPEQYRDRFHPEKCSPKAPVLPEPTSLTELLERYRPVLEQLVKEAWSPLKEYSDVVEFQKRVEEWPDRIRNQMAASSHRTNPLWVAQATELLKAVVRFQRKTERLASFRRCPERDALWDDVQRLADEVAAAETALAGVEGSGVETESPESALRKPSGCQTQPENAFLKKGQMRLLRFAGEEVSIPDAKGLEYISRLLRSPHEDVNALDLAGGVKELPIEVTDLEAAREYRQAIDDLDDEIASFEHDPVARSKLEEKKAAIQKETRFQGRVRMFADNAERARKAVSKCIGEALEKIKGQHESLWRHLDQSIRTGNSCSYRPETLLEWDL